MKKTPLQNVIDRTENLIKSENMSSEEKRKLNLVISYLWDELENERKVMSEIFDSGKKEHIDVTGKMWINKHFVDFQKFL